MSENFDDVVKEYIDFINRQTGVYMDALAGFEGHFTRVSRQIHRAQKPASSRMGQDGIPTVTWVSYEDPSKPEIIHNQILRTEDYLAANSTQGSNEQQHSQAILIFLFTYWEDEIRPRLSQISADQKKSASISSDIMGDLRILRNVILHAKGVISSDKYKSLKKLSSFFTPDKSILLSYEIMHKIFVLIKQDCARMLFDWLGVKGPLADPDRIVSLAIQKPGDKKSPNPKISQ